MNLSIIQGGMGVGVSGWELARAVSRLSCLGMVSSTGLDTLMARRLQMGDPGGHIRRAFEAFPVSGMAERVLGAYFVEGGKAEGARFKPVPMYSVKPPRELVELTVLANFSEVFLAKEGHDGKVGINLLEKIQLPTLPSLFGAMLAGVDVVAMGAGIPRSIPGILDDLASGGRVLLRLDVRNAAAESRFACEFDPGDFGCGGAEMKRPDFLAIISSAALAMTLARKATGAVAGFVVEGPSAGGHNAPPRGAMHLSECGEPVYGGRDLPDLEKIRELELPFWLAGSYGTPEGARDARLKGAVGVQVGTPFAFCEESGLATEIKRRVVKGAREGTLRVFTDPHASPTGFPFKVLQLEGSIADASLRALRSRVCDLGYLRETYQRPDGGLGYRCAGEPLESYLQKGGDAAGVENRICVCNGLMATAGVPQVRSHGRKEPALVTAGDGVCDLVRFLPSGADRYHARDVVDTLRVAMAC